MHKDRIQRTVTIHGFNYGVYDSTNPLFFCIYRVRTFFLDCCIVAITHFLQLICIEEWAQVGVAIAIERIFPYIRKYTIVLIGKSKLVHRIFDFSQR